MSETFASGIIPYITIEHKKYFLLGLEKSNNYWSGFVGGSETGETCVETAVREFHEETATIFEDYTPFIEEQLKRAEPEIDISPSAKYVYLYFIEFPVDCQEYISLFMDKKKDFTDACFHEKSILKWFSIEEIRRSKRVFNRLKQILLFKFNV